MILALAVTGPAVAQTYRQTGSRPSTMPTPAPAGRLEQRVGRRLETRLNTRLQRQGSQAMPLADQAQLGTQVKPVQTGVRVTPGTTPATTAPR